METMFGQISLGQSQGWLKVIAFWNIWLKVTVISDSKLNFPRSLFTSLKSIRNCTQLVRNARCFLSGALSGIVQKCSASDQFGDSYPCKYLGDKIVETQQFSPVVTSDQKELHHIRASIKTSKEGPFMVSTYFSTSFLGFSPVFKLPFIYDSTQNSLYLSHYFFTT